jgi:tRNA (guanine-N7-)-methyltransferase
VPTDCEVEWLRNGLHFHRVVELVPETYFAPLDLLAMFGRIAPLQVDLGCGDGGFLSEVAKIYSDKNFLGIEKLVGRVAKACRKAAALENVRIVNVESSYAVRYLLPPSSVETFYLLFPDPWPKRRHHRRRIVQPQFLQSIHRALEPGGILHIATDDLNYFEHMQRVVSADKLDGIMPSSFAADQSHFNLPSTKFEQRFRGRGAPIYRLALRKSSPVK